MTHPAQRFCLELREMLAAATQGWELIPDTPEWIGRHVAAIDDYAILVQCGGVEPFDTPRPEDAALIVALRNNAEKMLAVIEAAAAAITDSPPFEYGYAHYDALAKALAALGQP